MFKRIFWIGMILSGCVLWPIDEPMPLAEPIGPARRIVQQIAFIRGDSRVSMLAVLELDAQHIAMAGLSPEGFSLFNLNYDGKNLISDKSAWLPDSIAPERIMADLQLIDWPIDALRKSLPVGWRLEESDGSRVLWVRDKKHVQVDYLRSPLPEGEGGTWCSFHDFHCQNIELTDLQYRYSLSIKTVSYELISE